MALTNAPATPTGNPPSRTPATYSALFTDQDNDPYQGEYRDVMANFKTTVQPQDDLRPARLLAKIFAKSESELQAYLTLTHAHGKNYVQVLHRPSLLKSSLGSDEEDQQFGFLGDYRGGQPPQLVKWPTNAFEQTDQVAVVSPNTMDTALADDAEAELVRG